MASSTATVQSPRPSVVAVASPAPTATPKTPASTASAPRPSIVSVGS